ncbi:MAG: hypothetical protein QF769_06625 [Candidatus Marinimicrobia bacterium]|jgi:hypothetical protein|nr:hypothetical protein [Candidatus Neomarinimicrobiota bacterium]
MPATTIPPKKPSTTCYEPTPTSKCPNVHSHALNTNSYRISGKMKMAQQIRQRVCIKKHIPKKLETPAEEFHRIYVLGKNNIDYEYDCN